MEDMCKCKEIENQKEVAFYSASVNAWLSTALELDKNLLGLSAAGIGLLTTLVTTSSNSTCPKVIFYLLSNISFLACIIIVLLIFHKNRSYIAKIIDGSQKNSLEKLELHLSILDNLAKGTFAVGVLLSVCFGLFVTII